MSGCWEWLVPDDRVELALRGPGLVTQINSICGLCEGGCGVTVRQVDGLPVGLRGNPRHPLNRGGLCAVGQAGLEVLYSPDRLQGPLRRSSNGELVKTTWDAALDEIGRRLTDLRVADRADRFALLTGEHGGLSQQLATRFARALGSPHVAHVGNRNVLPFALTQGVDDLPGFDLAEADLVFSFGLDIFEDGAAPVHAMAAMIGSRPAEERCALVQVGTRFSPSAGKAEEHVPVLPGTHAALALGIAHVLIREGRYDRRFVREHTFGFDDWQDENGRTRLGFRRLLLERYYPDRAGRLCGCEPARIIRLARRFAAADAPLAIAGGEAVAGSNGTWTAVAVHALNALLGRFDRPGGVRLPAPIPLAPLDDLALPSGSLFDPPTGGAALGRDPLAALADGVLDGTHPLEMLVLWGTDPIHTSPVGDRLRAALEQIPTVIALTPVRSESAVVADFVLPTPTYLEAWHETTTPATVPASVLGVGQPVVEPLFDTRHPGDLLLDLSRRIGHPVAAALPWATYSDYLRHRLEGLVASGQGTVFTGSFEESWVQFLEERGWRFLEHDDVGAFWTDLVRESGWWNPIHSQGDWTRLFPAESGRFEFFSRALERHVVGLGASGSPDDPAAALAAGTRALGLVAEGDEACLPHFEPPEASGEGDLVLVPFRPMTGRGDLGTSSPMVLEMYGHTNLSGWETWAELGPQTAHELDLNDGDRVAVESDRAVAEAVVRINPGTGPGVVHVPLGLGHSGPRGLAGGRGSNPTTLLLPVPDTLSGRLSTTSTRVRLRLLERRPYGGPAPLHGGHG
jgi:anaerobic selenocysteine-containing dehydrogenase